jgi:hypothetical protein
MRIISPFRDYYDGVQRQDQDRSLVYVRNPTQTIIQNGNSPFPSFSNSYWVRHDSNFTINPHFIGFCGVVYPALKLNKYTFNYQTGLPSNITSYCYTIDDADKFVTANFPKQLDNYNKPKKAKSSFKDKWYKQWRRAYFVEYFDRFKEIQGKHIDVFLKTSPIFVSFYLKSDLFYNYDCGLKEYEFFKKFDSYRAYQELSMYLGGLAYPNKPIPQLTDELLAHAHGFDKFSFRKDKSK